MAYPYYLVDAFTNKPFGGNPAGVCILDEPGDPVWMQNVAAEMNQAETAFVYPTGNSFHLRWFTPLAEIELCGHATLATAKILWDTGRLPHESSAEFDTLSGRLSATKDGNWINLNFPATPSVPQTAPSEIIELLGVNPVAQSRSKYDILLELSTQSDVINVRPDFNRLAAIPAIRGVIVTSRSDDSNFDFVSRFFVPSLGVNEDPATGSTHCALSPYWSEKLGRIELTGHQVSLRQGVIRTTLLGDRVQLSGQAVIITNGQIL